MLPLHFPVEECAGAHIRVAHERDVAAIDLRRRLVGGEKSHAGPWWRNNRHPPHPVVARELARVGPVHVIGRDVLHRRPDVVHLYGVVPCEESCNDRRLRRSPVAQTLTYDDLRRDVRDRERAADVLRVVLGLDDIRIAERRTGRNGMVVEVGGVTPRSGERRGEYSHQDKRTAAIAPFPV